MSNHQDLTGRGAVHPFAFVQSTDPSLDPTNSVAPNKAWVDISAAPIVLRIRNSTNTAWTALLGAPVAGTAILPFTELDGPFIITGGAFAFPINFPPTQTILVHI